MKLLLLVALPSLMLGQATADPEVYHLNSSLNPPGVVSKVEPEYTEVARRARVQGLVLMQITIDEGGRATDITLLSPLGFGLDENAIAAVEKWRFKPATKDGKPVRIYATIEVNFRLSNLPYDDAAERRRARYNTAINELKGREEKGRARGLKTLEELAGEKYPPAMYLYGKYLEEVGGPARAETARDLIFRAAAENHPDAMFDAGRLQLDSKAAPEVEKGRELIRRAAVQGSNQAQYFLGASYESGARYPKNDDSAREYFLLCAAKGQSECQFLLGRSLYERPNRRERDLIQAVAWLELAQEQGTAEAKALLEEAKGKLTPRQASDAALLKRRLVQR